MPGITAAELFEKINIPEPKVLRTIAYPKLVVDKIGIDETIVFVLSSLGMNVRIKSLEGQNYIFEETE